MRVHIRGSAKDLRTDTPVIYAQMTVPDYLEMVGEDFENFAIQRRREKHRAYDRMKKDIMQGALLPSITLAVRPELVAELNKLVEKEDHGALAERLATPGQVNILDGLQRTYVLKEIKKEGHDFVEGQTVSLEFWLELSLEHLIYRIIVLNAGQKPMSMRHQVELLFSTLRRKIESEIPHLEILVERDSARRTRSRKYALDRLAGAYQAFITQSPEVRKENIVAQKLVESDVLDSDEDELLRQYESFIKYLTSYSELDDEVCRVYPSDQNDPTLTPGTQWFGSENVMNAFFSAISQLVRHESYKKRVADALGEMLALLRRSAPGDDPINLREYNQITGGFNPRKVNVGFATRKLLTNGFKEYFRESGNIPFKDCWTLAAE